MTRNTCLVLALGLMLGTVSRAPAQALDGAPLSVQLSDQIKRTKREKTATGVSETFDVNFTVELHNTSLKDPLANIHLRLIPYFIPYDFQQKDVGHRPGTIQTREDLTLAPNETLQVKFDPASFEKAEWTTKSMSGLTTTITTTHSGNDYTGIVLEIYIGDKLVGTRFNGNGLVRKAYEASRPPDAPSSGQSALNSLTQ